MTANTEIHIHQSNQRQRPIAGLDRSKDSVGARLLPLIKGERRDHPPVYGEQTNKQESPYARPEQNVHRESKKYMIITQDGYKLIYNRNYYAFERSQERS